MAEKRFRTESEESFIIAISRNTHNLSLNVLDETHSYVKISKTVDYGEPSPFRKSEIQYSTKYNVIGKNNRTAIPLEKNRIHDLPHFPTPQMLPVSTPPPLPKFIQKLNSASEVRLTLFTGQMPIYEEEELSERGITNVLGDIDMVPEQPEFPIQGVTSTSMEENPDPKDNKSGGSITKILSTLGDQEEPEISSLPTQISEQENIQVDKITKLKETNKTIVLDLDETLIHTLDQEEYEDLDEYGRDFTKGNIYTTTLQELFYIRPGLKQFLKFVSKTFECILFTAAEENYTARILAVIDPRNQYFDQVLTRKNCRITTGRNMETRFVKGLDLIDRNKTRVLIIDDIQENWKDDYDNLICVKPYEGQLDDKVLPKLTEILTKLSLANDIRKENKEAIIKENQNIGKKAKYN